MLATDLQLTRVAKVVLHTYKKVKFVFLPKKLKEKVMMQKNEKVKAHK